MKDRARPAFRISTANRGNSAHSCKLKSSDFVSQRNLLSQNLSFKSSVHCSVVDFDGVAHHDASDDVTTTTAEMVSLEARS